MKESLMEHGRKNGQISQIKMSKKNLRKFNLQTKNDLYIL